MPEIELINVLKDIAEHIENLSKNYEAVNTENLKQYFTGLLEYYKVDLGKIK